MVGAGLAVVLVEAGLAVVLVEAGLSVDRLLELEVLPSLVVAPAFTGSCVACLRADPNNTQIDLVKHSTVVS